MKNKLIELLKIEGKELISQFEKASVQGRGTPQEVADFREKAVHKILEKYYPFPYRIAKGNVIDSYGAESPSVDSLVINPAHPFTTEADHKFSVILADGVDVAIEVKPDLSDGKELLRGLKQIQKLKKLRRRESSLMPMIGKPNPTEDFLEFTRTIPAFFLAISVKQNPKDTVAEIVKFYEENSVPLVEQFDFIVVLDWGIIANYRYPEMTRAENNITGIFLEEWGELTFPALFLQLDYMLPSIPHMASPPIRYYLQGIQPKSFELFKK